MTSRRLERTLAAARRTADVDVISAEPHHRTETVAFDVIVRGKAIVGRWVQVDDGHSFVTWTDGSRASTDGCDGTRNGIIEAVRISLPARVLGMADERQSTRQRFLNWLTARRTDGRSA
jgi:hypothetical protein